MNLSLALVFATAFTTFAAEPAGYYSRTIFADDFSGNGFGPRWGHYKSSSVVKDGVLIGITAPTSDHSAVDNIKFPGERDLEVSVKFRFVSDKAKSFNVWFDDKDYKGSHAGHICSVSVSPTGVNLADAKTGGFDLTGGLYERKKANQLTDADKKMLATKAKRIEEVKNLSSDCHKHMVDLMYAEEGFKTMADSEEYLRTKRDKLGHLLSTL